MSHTDKASRQIIEECCDADFRTLHLRDEWVDRVYITASGNVRIKWPS